MEKILQYHLQARKQLTRAPLARGMGWGLMGGFVGTLAMDLLLIGALAAAGLPALTCFLIVGDTAAHLFSTLGMEMAGGVPLGVAAHYLIGPLMGTIFGAGMALIDPLRIYTRRRVTILAVVYVEIFSQPILALTPILLKMSAPETLRWFAASFGMHLIWGVVLGIVISRGQCRNKGGRQ
jgi:hypothetical protein